MLPLKSFDTFKYSLLLLLEESPGTPPSMEHPVDHPVDKSSGQGIYNSDSGHNRLREKLLNQIPQFLLDKTTHLNSC